MKKRPAKLVKTRHPLDVALGARIKAVRNMQNPRVSMQWLALECGCTLQQVGKYEAGETRVSFSRLCAIAKALDIAVIDLIRPIVE